MLLQHLREAIDFKALKKRRKTLSAEEREQVFKAKAVWNRPNGPESAVWKSEKANGDVVYVTNTHRCFQTAPSLKGAIEKFHSVVKDTA